MVDYLSSAFGITGTLWTVIQIIFVAVVVVIILSVVMLILKYKHRVRVRKVIGGKTLIIDDRAKEVTDAEGVLKWKLFKSGHCLPPPPDDAIHITSKGKYSVEAYFLPEGEYKYVIDNGVDTTKLVNFEPLDTADREFYASEMKEAEQYRKKTWTDYILPIAGAFTVVVVLVVLLAFWEDIAKPGIQIVDTAAEITEDQKETTKMLRDIIQNRQEIENIDIPTRDDSGGSE